MAQSSATPIDLVPETPANTSQDIEAEEESDPLVIDSDPQNEDSDHAQQANVESNDDNIIPGGGQQVVSTNVDPVTTAQLHMSEEAMATPSPSGLGGSHSKSSDAPPSGPAKKQKLKPQGSSGSSLPHPLSDQTPVPASKDTSKPRRHHVPVTPVLKPMVDPKPKPKPVSGSTPSEPKQQPTTPETPARSKDSVPKKQSAPKQMETDSKKHASVPKPVSDPKRPEPKKSVDTQPSGSAPKPQKDTVPTPTKPS